MVSSRWLEQEVPVEAERAAARVKAAAYRLHRKIGAGFRESVYQRFMAHALSNDGVQFRQKQPLAVEFEGLRIEDAGQPDFIVEECLAVELKAVERVHPVHAAQLINYLKAGDLPVGLLINFNVPLMKQGIERFVHPDLLVRKVDSDP